MLKVKAIVDAETEKEPYQALEVKIDLFEESFIRTSFGNDGFDDWEDEDAQPIIYGA